VQYTSAEILNWNQDNQDVSQNEDVEEEEEDDGIPQLDNQVIVSSKEAIAAFNTCLLWTEQNSNNIEDILVLKKLQECAVRKNLQATRTQSKITHYFKR
jgi:hypothetical protein